MLLSTTKFTILSRTIIVKIIVDKVVVVYNVYDKVSSNVDHKFCGSLKC